MCSSELPKLNITLLDTIVIKGGDIMFIPIIGFEDKYKIDEYGNVLNLKTGSIMRPYINNKGYKVIDLMKKWN